MSKWDIWVTSILCDPVEIEAESFEDAEKIANSLRESGVLSEHIACEGIIGFEIEEVDDAG